MPSFEPSHELPNRAMPAPDHVFLHRLADAADAVTLPLFRTRIDVASKKAGHSEFDPVTEADKGAELAMRTLIEATFPDHGIAGEEFPDIRPEAEHVWHLDPIDGTRQYIAGMPLWGTMIGLAVHGSPTLGLVSQPFTRERFTGGAGEALYRGPSGERSMRARACPVLGDAILFTTSPHIYKGAKAEAFGSLEGRVRLARYGIDCYAFALLALGHIDIAIETGLDDHDIVPLVPIIEAAGGAVVDWQGNRAVRGGDALAVGDRRLIDQILPLLT